MKDSMFTPAGLIQMQILRPLMPEVGDRAPDFMLYDAERKVRNLSEFLVPGRRTILAFFPGAFTSTCTTEMCTFRDMYGELEKMNGMVVGISVDSPFAQKAFAEKHGLTFPLLCDFKRELIEKYEVVWKNLGGVEGYNSANRAIFVVDGSGTIVFKWIAEGPGKLPDFEAVKKAL
jgi:peroxiredoxin